MEERLRSFDMTHIPDEQAPLGSLSERLKAGSALPAGRVPPTTHLLDFSDTRGGTGPSGKQMVGRLALSALPALLYLVLHWTTTSNLGFEIGPNGAWKERMCLLTTSVTGGVANFHGIDVLLVPGLAVFLGPPIAAAVLARHNLFYRIVGYVAVQIWFLVGLAMTSIAIT